MRASGFLRPDRPPGVPPEDLDCGRRSAGDGAGARMVRTGLPSAPVARPRKTSQFRRDEVPRIPRRVSPVSRCRLVGEVALAAAGWSRRPRNGPSFPPGPAEAGPGRHRATGRGWLPLAAAANRAEPGFHDRAAGPQPFRTRCRQPEGSRHGPGGRIDPFHTATGGLGEALATGERALGSRSSRSRVLEKASYDPRMATRRFPQSGARFLCTLRAAGHRPPPGRPQPCPQAPSTGLCARPRPKALSH